MKDICSDWRYDSSSRVPAFQVQIPEFKPQSKEAGFHLLHEIYNKGI
jgi:hypothetical protein